MRMRKEMEKILLLSSYSSFFFIFERKIFTSYQGQSKASEKSWNFKQKSQQLRRHKNSSEWKKVSFALVCLEASSSFHLNGIIWWGETRQKRRFVKIKKKWEKTLCLHDLFSCCYDKSWVRTKSLIALITNFSRSSRENLFCFVFENKARCVHFGTTKDPCLGIMSQIYEINSLRKLVLHILLWDSILFDFLALIEETLTPLKINFNTFGMN